MDDCKLQVKLFVEANTKEEAQQTVGNIWTELKDCIVQERIEAAEVYWKMEDVYIIQCSLVIKPNTLIHLQEKISDNWLVLGLEGEELLASRTNEKCAYMRDKIVMANIMVECNIVGDKIRFKIEKGTQLGITLRVEKETEFGWYDYAVQKKENLYYVYESEILESNMAQEKYEYETITKYLTLEEVMQNYPCKYGTRFVDIHPLKGQRIFSVEE